nr:hypothetical protein P5648_20500 [Bacillus subtilis]
MSSLAAITVTISKQKRCWSTNWKHHKRRAPAQKSYRRSKKSCSSFIKIRTLRSNRRKLEKRGGAYYSDAACNLISSIYNDKHDIQPVNTINNGAIASISDDSAVEVNCVMTKTGPKPIAVGDLPVSVRGLVQQIKSFERVAAEAAVTGDYQTALLAMTINPLVPSDTVAKQILDEMLEAHKAYLPQFFNKIEA